MKSFSQIMRVPYVPGLDLPGIDIPALAQGYGCRAARIEKAQDLAPALSSALAAERPTLLDVIVDPSVPVLYSV
jgi:benzoylformate decarboxylase